MDGAEHTSERCDVCIVGSGVAGLNALFAASRFAATYMLSAAPMFSATEKTLQTYTALAPPRIISAKGYKNVSG